MLLRITVLQYKGTPPPAALAYMFDERGGSIGREGCNLTLPDETRVLSRVQAQIVFSDGLFSLVDQGGNPSVVNSLRVGKGLSRPLYDGDIIELGDYKLRVKAIGFVAKSDADTVPMRANDPMPSLDLAPPILLDPEELTGIPDIVVKEAAEESLDMTFEMEMETGMDMEMDVDFDDLDSSQPVHANHAESISFPDPSATVGMYAPLGEPFSAAAASIYRAPEVMLEARDLAPTTNPEHAAMLSALCLGLGIAPPHSAAGMPPQHMGIVMRRAMQRALSSVLASFTPEGLEKRLADRALLQMQPPSDRNGALWALFEQGHAEISHEAEDHFQSLFNSEFLKAFEAQTTRLREHN